MRIVGYIAVSLVGLGAAAGAVLGAVSIPDIKRYLRIRSM